MYKHEKEPSYAQGYLKKSSIQAHLRKSRYHHHHKTCLDELIPWQDLPKPRLHCKDTSRRTMCCVNTMAYVPRTQPLEKGNDTIFVLSRSKTMGIRKDRNK